MKTTIKFMLALGNTKLVMTKDDNGHAFYSATSPQAHPRTSGSVKRIISCLSAAK